MQGVAPSAATLAACFVLCQRDEDMSKADFAEATGRDRTTVHRWLSSGRAEEAYEQIGESDALRRELVRLAGTSAAPADFLPPPAAEPADVIDEICRAIVEAALWPREAAIGAGVPPGRAGQWEREARAAEPDSPLGELWRRVEWAEAKLERALNTKLIDQGSGWQAAREVRARRFPTRYGNADGGVVVVRPLADVPLAELAFVNGS